MRMQSLGNSHCQRVGQIQNLSPPNLRNACGPRALHDWRNSPKVQRILEFIRYRIVITLLSKNYNAPSQLSIYLANLLLDQAASEAEFVNLKTLNDRLQNIFRLVLNDQNAPKHFQSFPYDARKPAPIVDLSYDHVNSTGNGLNYSCHEARSYSTEHGTFSNYINKFDGNGRQESFSHTIKRRSDNCFSNSINCNSSSGCLDDIFMPLKRPKLQTSLFSCPYAVQPSTSQRSPELPQQHNSPVILNGEVSVVDTKASADFTRVSTGTHDVGNIRWYNCLCMNEKTTQVPSEEFIIDKDAEQIAYPRRFWKTWENVEKGSGMEMESQVNTELRLGMKENLNNYISLKGWTGKEQNSDSMSVPSKEFIIDNDPLKIECPIKTCKTWENVDEGYIYFDSSNFNLINVGMDVECVAETEFNLGMLENLNNCTDLKTDHGKEHNSETMQVPPEAVINDKDPQKIGYSSSTCKTWENIEDPIRNELKLGNLNNSADHGKGQASFFLIREKEQNYETIPVPPEACIIDKDPQKIGYTSTSTCKTWENIKDPMRNELKLGSLNNSAALEADHGKGQTSFFLIREKEQNYETIAVSPSAVIIDKDPQKIGYSTSTCKTWVEDPIRNELNLGSLNNSAALEADHGKGQASFFLSREKEQNYETIPVPPKAVIIDKYPQKIGYTSTSTWKTCENKENYSICSVSTNVAFKDEGMDVKDSIRNESELEKFNNCTALKADHEKEHNYGTMPTPSKKSIIDEDSQKIMCSTILCKTSANMKKRSICNDSSHDTSFNERMEVKDEVRNAMHEDLNKYIVPKVDHDEIQNLEKIKMSGVSLVEFFTEDEVRRHISSLKQSDSLSARENTGDIHLNGCDLCSIDKLYFTPVPLYCSNCAGRIKHHGHYFSTTEENNLLHYLCLSCHKLAVRKKGNLPKMTMEAKSMCKKKNDEETQESWVQCDKCKRWQHQICALYNYNKDLEGKAAYTCPKCLLKDIQHRERRELKSRLVAKDLPTTMLSDHIENRLFSSLKKERKLRAEMAGKRTDEVQGVEGLVVRVVSSVEKQLKVKKSFWDIFKKQNYPTEFPYRSKAIVVFQNIEGVDVCLFAMYIQEFGLECGPQNRRCVYISYLDSVKYFTPDIESGNGEALRSFVYHEVMIASLEFFKKRGFASCYLWACPPPKGEDYIFYCHPKNQKTPKSDKLRKWYRLMLKKAAKEGIVVNFTNLYDHFFVTSEVSNLKVTATRLPYFEGDYWTTAAERIIKSFEEDKDGGSNIKRNKQVTKRTLRAMGHEKPSNCSIDDILLMQKLGENILSSKEDFMIVQLQFFCIRCDEAILSGKRWFCRMCPNFQLCERCHSTTGQGLNRLGTHTSINMETHMLSQVEVDIPFIKADDDVVMENSLFDDRQSFLDFCQKKRYQFDTLRRAKHSSMMILNDLKQNLATVGKACGLLQLLQLAQHLSECIKRRDPGRCSTPHCVKMKKMFQHWSICTTHAGGGCSVCKKAVNLLVAHSRKCQNSECGIPRCNDLKKQRSSNSHLKLMPKDGTAVHSH